jgi:hypothetical protein
LTTLYADHSDSHHHQGDLIDDICYGNEEEKLCFRAKRMMICRDADVATKTEDVVISVNDFGSAAWGYFVDTFEDI